MLIVVLGVLAGREHPPDSDGTARLPQRGDGARMGLRPVDDRAVLELGPTVSPLPSPGAGDLGCPGTRLLLPGRVVDRQPGIEAGAPSLNSVDR